MHRKSASTLIYFHDRTSKRKLQRRPVHINREKRANRIRSIIYLAGFVVAVVIGVWYYQKYRPLDITSVTMEGTQRFVNVQDVQKIAEEKVLDKNIVFTDLRELENVILTNFLAVKSVEIQRRTPTSLVIQVIERTPIALILPPNKSDKSEELTYYFVDAEGFVLGSADKSTTNLPVINYGQEVSIGKFVEAESIRYYFDLIKALDADGVYASTISTFPRYTQFSTTDNTEVVFTNDQPAKSQVKIYNKLIEALKAEGKGVRKIDLRFDKVIVEFNKN